MTSSLPRPRPFRNRRAFRALRAEVLALMTLTSLTAMPAAAPFGPAPQSSVTLPVTVPLAGLRAAALARLPDVLASVDQTQTLAGGVIVVHLTGEVRRSGDLTLVPEGDGLRLSLPVNATFRAAPTGLGDFLARDFTGAAVVTAHVTPGITGDWNADLRVQADYRWTAPLSFELLRGVSINVQTLVDPQIRARLAGASEALGAAARSQLRLRERAGDLWARLAQPWALPGVPDGYALIRPQGLTVTPFTFTPDAASVTLGGSFVATAGLGQAPGPVPPAPLPPLKLGRPQADGVTLDVPVTLAYPQLSALATRYAARQEYRLPLPLSPRLKVGSVTLGTPAPGRLNAAVAFTVRAPLGLNVNATVDVSGTPTLDGQTLRLTHVTVRTRPSSLSGRVLGWLADARVQALLAKQATFDLTPELQSARAAVQARLPYRVANGVTLSGQVDRLALRSVSVEPQGVVAVTRAEGELDAHVDLR
ncbi:DUF4403 family protein [Deinococcus aquiradiocola]|uniref:DUF4403 family protein n=1 Tax=Deinococcus aquiradiocola TaxID=393059 RepID=A0A917PP94_9DEIO|nr:DUF4403 family protein [Deinococcus aquiradiocola]GGJ86793.1 hypothetical protein GCM10008939_33460 [Deinococcus aquiradiocola]